MSRKITIANHYTIEEWKELIPRNQDFGIRYRMLVIERILSNPTINSRDLCKEFYITPDTLFRWIKQYNKNGLEGLISAKGFNSGRRKTYDDKIFDDLKNEIDKDNSIFWTLDKMQDYLKEKYNIKPTLQAIWYRIKDTHSHKSSRPYPKQANRDELGRFKKKG